MLSLNFNPKCPILWSTFRRWLSSLTQGHTTSSILSLFHREFPDPGACNLLCLLIFHRNSLDSGVHNLLCLLIILTFNREFPDPGAHNFLCLTFVPQGVPDPGVYNFMSLAIVLQGVSSLTQGHITFCVSPLFHREFPDPGAYNFVCLTFVPHWIPYPEAHNF